MSNYINSSGISNGSGLVLNNGVGANAVAAGLQTRYAPGGTSGIGFDAFAYQDGTTYVIASPALLAGLPAFSGFSSDFTNSEYFAATVSGVTDNGEVFGYFTASKDGTSANTIGQYYFEWT